MGRHEVIYSTHRQLEAVAIVKEQLNSLGIFDGESIKIALESETDIIEAIDKIVIAENEYAEDMKKMDRLIATYRARKDAYNKQKEALRVLLSVVLEHLDEKSRKTAFGTIVRRLNALSIKVKDESLVPAEYFKLPEPPPPPEPIIDMIQLSADTLAIHKKRLELLQKIRAPFELEIKAANALPDNGEKETLLKAIEEKLRPEFEKLNEELPLPDGVEVSEQTYSLSILRGKPKDGADVSAE